jgi:hypothetical protein
MSAHTQKLKRKQKKEQKQQALAEEMIVAMKNKIKSLQPKDNK